MRREWVPIRLTVSGMGNWPPNSTSNFFFDGGGGGVVWHSLFVFVFLALINGFAGFRFPLLHLYGIKKWNSYSVFPRHYKTKSLKLAFTVFVRLASLRARSRLIWKSCYCFLMLLKIPTLSH